MSYSIKIPREFYNKGERIFDKGTLTFEPGITVLIGCNGSGKSTILRHIKDHCRREDIPVLYYDNFTEGGNNAKSKAMSIGNMKYLQESMISSEGENINLNFGYFISKVGKYVRGNILPDPDNVLVDAVYGIVNERKKLFILCDAIDSGLSIDYILQIKDVFHLIIDDCKNDADLYIIVSANEYELARKENCFNVVKCRYEDIHDYETYRKVIINTRKRKQKRYGFEEFNYD